MNPDCQRRIENLQRRLHSEELPALLVTDVFNVTYLTGFTGDSSWLLVMQDRVILLSDTRYSEQLSEECPGLAVEIRSASQTTLGMALEIVTPLQISRLGIEAASISRALSDQLQDGLKTTALVSTSGWVEQFRAVKDATEIASIRRSIAVNEEAFLAVLSRIHGSMTEREIAFDLENEIRRLGGDRCAFPPIVGVGERAALPHGRPTSKRIGESPFVLIDWGASVGGYASDLTRVVVTGKPPAKLVEIYDIVLRAQIAAIDCIRPGAEFRTVDQAARQLIADAGFGDCFGHGLGHGFGLQIHEIPFINPTRAGVLEAGMVVTVEPGIYLPGVAGVRIEDDVLVTPDGCERLSRLPREFEAASVRLSSSFP